MADNKDLLEGGKSYLIIAEKSGIIRNHVTTATTAAKDDADKVGSYSYGLPPASYAVEAPEGVKASVVGRNGNDIPSVKALMDARAKSIKDAAAAKAKAAEQKEKTAS